MNKTCQDCAQYTPQKQFGYPENVWRCNWWGWISEDTQKEACEKFIQNDPNRPWLRI